MAVIGMVFSFPRFIASFSRLGAGILLFVHFSLTVIGQNSLLAYNFPHDPDNAIGREKAVNLKQNISADRETNLPVLADVYSTTPTRSISGASVVNPNPFAQTYTFKTKSDASGHSDFNFTSNGWNGSPIDLMRKTQASFSPPVVTDNQTICYNTTPASLNATDASGGTGPYSYQWQSSSDNSSWSDIPGETVLTYEPPALTVSTYYRIVATDLGVPAESNSVLITVNPRPTAVISGNATICEGAGTNITITFTGTAPFTYSINGNANIVAAANPETVAVSPSGTTVYTVTSLSDANCLAQAGDLTGSATVTINPSPTATIDGTTTVCQELLTFPEITFTGTSGTAPFTFTYTVNGGLSQTVTTISGNSAIVYVPTGTTGTYTYALAGVSDANSCSQVQSGTATVTVNPLPDVTATPSSQIVYCPGQSNIALSSTIPGTLFSWTATPSSANVSGFTNLSGVPGPIRDNLTNSSTAIETVTYEITPTAKGCDGASIQVVVRAPAALSVTATPSPVNCFGGNDGTITALAEGGEELYLYRIDNGTTWITGTPGDVFLGL